MTGAPRKVSTRWLLVAALAVIVVLAAVASVLASHSPDGLTKVSQQQGFADQGQDRHGLLSYGPVAGVVGMLVVLALAAGLTRVARRRARPNGSDGSDTSGTSGTSGTSSTTHRTED